MSVTLRMEQAVAQAFATAGDAEDTYERVLQAVAANLGWPFGAAWEPDSQHDGVLHCVALWAEGADAESFAQATRATTLPAGEGLPGRVLAAGHAVWVSDFAGADDLPRHEAAARAGLHAALAFPVRSERGVVGVVELLGPLPLEPDELLLGSMEVLGAQLGQLVERRRAEQASRRSEQRHRATLQAALDGIVTMDHEGCVVDFNPAAERMFGFVRADVVGREMADLIVPPELRARHRAGVARYLATERPKLLDRRIEIEAVRAGGERFPVELTITRVDVPGAPLFTGHIRDITDRRRAEAELRASRARIVEASDAARRRIERDLHDGAQQQLVGVAMSLRAARGRVEADAAAAGALLDDAIASLGAAIAELRELARGIHPAVLTEGGLGPALRGLVQRSAVPAQLVAVPDGRQPAAVEAAAYFVVAEGLTNCARHAADATLVEIEVEHVDGLLRVEVRDDGCGGADPSGGGLRGLADRLAALDGTLEVGDRADGPGTSLKAVLPCAS